MKIVSRCSLLVMLAANVLVTDGLAETASLITTFTNPSPAEYDYFGTVMAAVGPDKVLIGTAWDDTGAEDAGAAYLFSLDGTLLSTFTNPTPVAFEEFASAVSALGTNRVIIGAVFDNSGVSNSGTAYLYDLNGSLVMTFTNPAAADGDHFGESVAGVGDDKVIIGSTQKSIGASAAGAAFLFNTNGALLTTFTNPTPVSLDYFGYSVAAVGTDSVLIGAWQDDTGAANTGAAYLFDLSGNLMTTFTNPAPAANDHFGYAIASVGSDEVLIGVDDNVVGALKAGAAYLFSTNGTLLTTITNPTPYDYDYFGRALAGVGDDRVLIGAHLDDTGAIDTGAAYLFDLNGVLLTTITNPAPGDYDNFGSSMVGFGSDMLLISAWSDSSVTNETGAAYLYSVQSVAVPTLSIGPASLGQATISWLPATGTNWVLQESLSLSPANWTNSPSGSTNPIVVPATLPTKFYRLYKP